MNHGVTVTVIKYILTSIENQNVKIKNRRNFHKGNYKDTRKYLAKLDWKNLLMNKTPFECWNILKYEIGSINGQLVPLKKNKENGIKRNIFQKKLLEK